MNFGFGVRFKCQIPERRKISSLTLRKPSAQSYKSGHTASPKSLTLIETSYIHER